MKICIQTSRASQSPFPLLPPVGNSVRLRKAKSVYIFRLETVSEVRDHSRKSGSLNIGRQRKSRYICNARLPGGYLDEIEISLAVGLIVTCT
jgi:hypothetical protein